VKEHAAGMNTIRTVLALLLVGGLAGVTGLAGGCKRGPGDDEATAVQRQILQQLAALQDDVDEIKDTLAGLQAAPAAPPGRPAAPAAAPAPPATTSMPVQTVGFPSLGRKDAPLTIVEFSDFQCPFCRRHFATTLPQIKANYVETGKVRYVLIDNPIPSHRYAAQAAEAAHCAEDQGKYWEMHDYLFNNQNRIQPDNLPIFAKDLGLDAATFSACMADNRHESQIQAGSRLAAAAGARGTPSFVLGKTGADGSVSGELIVGAKAYAMFKDRFDQLLAN
jgi:protein-disulfide isomerase